MSFSPEAFLFAIIVGRKVSLFVSRGCFVRKPLHLTLSSRLVKIFELAFPLEVTPLPLPTLRLVFRSTLIHTQRHYGRQRLRGELMDWKHLLAYITGTVDQELLLRNEYLVTENRILRNQLKPEFDS